MLVLGSRGGRVRYIQALLKLKVDGVFGIHTENAVKVFQRASGIPQDGMVGKNTWAKLNSFAYNAGIIKANQAILPKRHVPKNVNYLSDIHTLDRETLTGIAHSLLKNFKNTKRNEKLLVDGLIAVSKVSKELNLNSLVLLCHFMGQVKEEIGLGMILRENLYYSAKALPKIFSYYSKNRSEASQDGYTKHTVAHPTIIANKVYAHRYGNGSPASGDGWDYRGMDFIHTTFRRNVERSQIVLDKLQIKDSELSSLDFKNNPQLRCHPSYALLSGALFWSGHKSYNAVKSKSLITEDDSRRVTAIHNKYTASYNARWRHTQTFAKLLGLPHE